MPASPLPVRALVPRGLPPRGARGTTPRCGPDADPLDRTAAGPRLAGRSDGGGP